MVNIIVNYCCKRKMPKETKTEEAIGCFVTFLSLVAFQLEGAAPLPSGYADASIALLFFTNLVVLFSDSVFAIGFLASCCPLLNQKTTDTKNIQTKAFRCFSTTCGTYLTIQSLLVKGRHSKPKIDIHLPQPEKGHSGRKFFCSAFSQNILPGVKTIFPKFELFTTFRSRNNSLDFPLERLFLWKNFSRVSKQKRNFKK